MTKIELYQNIIAQLKTFPAERTICSNKRTVILGDYKVFVSDEQPDGSWSEFKCYDAPMLKPLENAITVLGLSVYQCCPGAIYELSPSPEEFLVGHKLYNTLSIGKNGVKVVQGEDRTKDHDEFNARRICWKELVPSPLSNSSNYDYGMFCVKEDYKNALVKYHPEDERIDILRQDADELAEDLVNGEWRNELALSSLIEKDVKLADRTLWTVQQSIDLMNYYIQQEKKKEQRERKAQQRRKTTQAKSEKKAPEKKKSFFDSLKESVVDFMDDLF